MGNGSFFVYRIRSPLSNFRGPLQTVYGANARTARWKLSKRQTNPPVLDLRNATPGEIARIKGEWERLEVRYIKGKVPELEGKYLEEARRTLRRALDRGDRDPRLLASFGLLELEAENKPLARDLLEQSVAQEVQSPRAYFELAKLRCEYLLERSNRNDGKPNAEQVNSVVELLLTATKHPPSLPEVYELLVEVCLNSSDPPTSAALTAIDEGVKLFPKDSDLGELVALLRSDDKDHNKTGNKPSQKDDMSNYLRDRFIKENRNRLSR